MEHDAANAALGGMLPWELKQAYERGENLNKLMKQRSGNEVLLEDQIELSYDLQSGAYAAAYDTRQEIRDRKAAYCGELAKVIEEMGPVHSILDAGVGEGTSLHALLAHFKMLPPIIHGVDLCWSRLAVCRDWLARQVPEFNVTVASASLVELPYAENSFDVVYTTHALEPNRGREGAILAELHRVCGRYMVLVEPAYELATQEAKQRMDEHGYCQNLKQTALELGFHVVRYEKFVQGINPLNPSALLVIAKDPDSCAHVPKFACPTYRTNLNRHLDCFYSESSMLAYPIIGGIPCLRRKNGIVASKFSAYSSPA